jgi:cytidine deaminase
MNNELYQKSIEAQKMSYSPYSKVTVGAALLTSGGNIYQGCNIENSSYGATICAERTAIFNAVLNGEREFKEIAITSNLDDFIFPCGMCLQVMAEFSDDLAVYSTNGKGEVIEKNIKELFPFAFRLAK